MKFFLRNFILIAVLSYKVFAQDPSTWNTIQEKILDVNCTSCHYYGSSYADQSGLILTAGASYNQLVNVQPKNIAAKNDGLVRVSTQGGLAGLVNSFLWEKINAPEQEHFYEDHPEYGSIMPLGYPSLTNGELQFIMRWIVQGAPESGIVADENLLRDTTRYYSVTFAPLEPPVNGIQLHVGPFDVQPNQVNDREFLYFKPFNHTEDIYINSAEIIMRPGSHHFILYTFDPGMPQLPEPDTYRDIRDSTGKYNLEVLLQMFYHRFFGGTQTPYLNYHMPDGVAMRLPPGTGFDINSHYVNRSNNVIQGEVYANLHALPMEEVRREAKVLFLSNEDIVLTPHDTTTIISEHNINSDINLFQMWAHSHEHTIEFKVERVSVEGDSEMIYYSTDWQHPPIARLNPPIIIHAGEKIKLVTTYYNWTDKTINFGLLSSDEMQILYGMYYTGEPLTSIENDKTIPSEFKLEQNYPNPFNPVTSMQYTIGSKQLVTLKIYDLMGKEVSVLINEEKDPGIYEIKFDASKLSSGVYFYKLTAGSYSETKKMILMK